MRSTMKTTPSAPTGSNGSSPQDTSPRAASIGDLFSTSAPPTSPATPKSTSSPASESGPQLCAPKASETTSRSGPGAARASLSPRQAKEAGLMTSGTYGRRSTGLSSSAALQESLASRLQALTGYAGSILFRTTWKERATPSGRRIPALRARAWTLPTAKKAAPPSNGYEGPFYIVPIPNSPPGFLILPHGLAQDLATALHTSASVSTGWPTPDASVSQDGETFETWEARRLATKARVGNGNGFGTPLTMAAQLAPWPTPTKGNADGSQIARDASATGKRPDGSKATASLNQVAMLASWSTPQVADVNHARGTPEYAARTMQRAQPPSNNALQAHRAAHPVPVSPLATPTTRDHKDGASEGTAPINGLLGRQVWQARTGSSAPTEKPGRLNPEFSLSLMLGPLATVWASCAPPATRSSSRKRGSSSKRQSVTVEKDS